MGRDRKRPAPEHGVADAGIGIAFERRHHDLVAAYSDDLTAARAALAALLDAEPCNAGEAARLVMGGRDHDDAAAAAEQCLRIVEPLPDAFERGQPIR